MSAGNVYEAAPASVAAGARARKRAAALYELLEHEPPLGFALLPKPAKGDVFFDMEGDPLYEPGRGLEYLFGCWMPDEEPRISSILGHGPRGREVGPSKPSSTSSRDVAGTIRRCTSIITPSYEKDGAAPARAAALHARRRDRRAAARRSARRSVRSRAPGTRDFGRALRPQERRTLLRPERDDGRQAGRRVDRHVRALAYRARSANPRRHRAATIATIAGRRSCCAIGCSCDGPRQLQLLAASFRCAR